MWLVILWFDCVDDCVGGYYLDLMFAVGWLWPIYTC